ncbi:hypothetical protein [Paracandidimonas lactea]|uniref:hypothetical protein n=1 Tax=Paracandidimonas lactea TaxID=2895524 RepID=UPI001F1DF3C4|nr:hypothetical protein [Paracandidimonas lactea]
MNTTPDTRMLGITQQAALCGIGAMSLGEALTAALVLNRSDWLRDCGYSIADALDRIGPEWAARLSAVSRQFHDEVTQAQLRFSFEIVPHQTHTGGFTLRLLEAGEEVGGGQFIAQGDSGPFTDEQSAYGEALATGRSWLVGKQSTVFPELSR